MAAVAMWGWRRPAAELLRVRRAARRAGPCFPFPCSSFPAQACTRGWAWKDLAKVTPTSAAGKASCPSPHPRGAAGGVERAGSRCPGRCLLRSRSQGSRRLAACGVGRAASPWSGLVGEGQLPPAGQSVRAAALRRQDLRPRSGGRTFSRDLQSG